jgi:DNA-binding NarL/FixJ family response regulator
MTEREVGHYAATRDSHEPAHDSIVERRQCLVVLLWNGVRIYREGLCAALATDRRIRQVVAVGDAAGCVEAMSSLRPEVLVIDALAEEALTVARSLRDSPVGVVALGVAEAEPSVVAFAEAGVTAYVTREQPLESLVSSIVAVSAGEAHCSPKIAAILMRHVAVLAGQREQREQRPVHLTCREAEVLALVTDGLTNKQIAHRLSIELATVKNHVHNIFEKLGVRSRAQAVAATSGPAPAVTIAA